MLESQRKVMLEDMGLRIFQPRFLLPGARVSVLLPPELPLAVTPGAEKLNCDSAPVDSALLESATVESATVANATAVPQAANVEMLATPSVAPPPEPEAAPVPAGDWSGLFDNKPATRANVAVATVAAATDNNKLAEVPLRFRHRLVRVGEFLMLLDQPSLDWVDAERCKAFFGDIHFALTGKRYEYWQDARFDWPPARNFPHANDRVMAQEALHVFLQEHMQQPHCRWIFLWGDAVCHSTLFRAASAGETAFLSNVPVLMLDACQPYWQEPLKKKLLWQYLQVVRKSLADNG